jgi:hypothetical protein
MAKLISLISLLLCVSTSLAHPGEKIDIPTGNHGERLNVQLSHVYGTLFRQQITNSGLFTVKLLKYGTILDPLDEVNKIRVVLSSKSFLNSIWKSLYSPNT